LRKIVDNLAQGCDKLPEGCQQSSASLKIKNMQIKEIPNTIFFPSEASSRFQPAIFCTGF